MITTNVYQRVFQVKIGESTGTCFTVDIEGKQYIITARHVIDGWNPGTDIQIFHEKQWKNIGLSLVGRCEGKIDIAVLSAPIQLSPKLDLPATAGGIIWGQDVYFLGFPYGWYGDIEEMNRHFPMPSSRRQFSHALSCKMTAYSIFFLTATIIQDFLVVLLYSRSRIRMNSKWPP